jgi:hypothetical protein
MTRIEKEFNNGHREAQRKRQRSEGRRQKKNGFPLSRE